MAAYGAGLRISEAFHLRVEAIDSQRMIIHVRHGEGDRDRFTMLPRRLLEERRAYFREAGAMDERGVRFRTKNGQSVTLDGVTFLR